MCLVLLISLALKQLFFNLKNVLPSCLAFQWLCDFFPLAHLSSHTYTYHCLLNNVDITHLITDSQADWDWIYVLSWLTRWCYSICHFYTPVPSWQFLQTGACLWFLWIISTLFCKAEDILVKVRHLDKCFCHILTTVHFFPFPQLPQKNSLQSAI